VQAHTKNVLLLLTLAAADSDLSAMVKQEVAKQECRFGQQGDAVTVCGRREQQRRYQVTDPAAPYDPKGPVKGVMRERMGWISEGDTGPGSCSGVGPGGWTGCGAKAFRQRLQQKGWLVR